MHPDPKSTFLLKLGAHIRWARKRKGLTMEDLSNDIEIEYRQLGRIERGEVNPTILSLLKIAMALDLSLKELLDFE